MAVRARKKAKRKTKEQVTSALRVSSVFSIFNRKKKKNLVEFFKGLKSLQNMRINLLGQK